MFLFHSKQWADDLKLMGHRAKLRFVNGFALFTSEKYVETFSTPKETIAEKERITLYYFAPKKPVKKYRPTLFIPPLMTPAYVYDLRKGHSFIEYMLSQGRSIYLLDFGNPSEDEANIQLDSYLYEAVEYAIDKTLQHSQSEKINLIGYSMGGIFTYLYTGVFGAKNISAIITLGSPVDFSKIWLFSFLVRILGRRVGHFS